MTQRKFSSRINRLLLSLWLPLCILLAGYGIANHFSSLKQLEQQQYIKQSVMQRLSLITDGVRENVSLYEYGLRGTRAAVMTVTPEQLNYQLMLAYSQSRDYAREFPGARGFGVIRYIKPNEKALFLAKMAEERPNFHFNIKQLQPHNDSLFVIQYIEPEQRNVEAIGLDIGSEPMRRKAALDAALTNEVRFTAPVTLVQANEKTQQGFLILLPIYYTSSVPAEPAARLTQLYGWSYAPILIDEVLNTVSGLQDDVTLSIVDITDAAPLAFFNRGKVAENLAKYQQQLGMSLLGRQWQLTLTPNPAFISALQLSSKGALFREVLGGTLLLALLVFLMQLLIMRNTQKVRHKAELSQIAETTLKQANIELEQLVEARTEEISRVNTLQRSILSGAGYAIVATDTSGFITAFNPAAERLLGYQASEVVQKCTPAIFHVPEELQQHAAKLSAELGIDTHADFESLVAKARQGLHESRRWTYVTKQGDTVQVKLNVSALTDENNQRVGYLGIAFDLTEQLKRESELAKAKEQAEIASQAKSDFLANMSHEIRTPMNAILGLLQLTANTQLDKRQADYIEKTQRAASSLLALLNDILDFSKVEAGKLELDPQVFNLPNLLQDISIILWSDSQSKHLTVQYHIADDVPEQLFGDSLRIKQVLLNIAGNAIKFTEQGTVIISIHAQPLPDNGLQLLCRIKDTGIGMSAEQQKVIFSGFHQAESSISRRYGGTGLGLSISKRLINLMGGNISVQSELGKGSEFSFDFMLKQVDKDADADTQLPTAPQLAAPTRPQTPLAGLTLLLVEDNATNQLVASELLQAQGAVVDIASSGEDALTLLATKPTRYNLVLMDIQMPDMDGYQTTRHIRQQAQFASLPIVAMTANALPSDKAACLAAGMQDHIAKPFSLDEVIAKTLLYCQRTAETSQATSSVSFDPPTLHFCQQHDIALEQACARLGHSTELYAKVLRQFIADLQHYASQLLSTDITVKSAALLFHSLKGAAGTVGFTTISKLAAEYEHLLNTCNAIDEVSFNAALASITDNQPIALALLNLIDNEITPDDTLHTNAEIIPNADLQAQLKQLMVYLTVADMAALPLFRQLAHQLQLSHPELVQNLNKEISALAFDAAAAILKPLLSEK